jgi:hypothetical protein
MQKPDISSKSFWSNNPEPACLLSEDVQNHCIYIDSPVLSALRQIEPFYRSGIFDFCKTPLFLRMNATIRMQLMATKPPREVNLHYISGKKVGQFPIARGGVVFYPFNSKSNVTSVTNRDFSHVLTLHGESNKLASYRPAARLYDYICIAGPLARNRYLDSGIFTPADVDQGRLVMMGDSFVQTMDWIRLAKSGETGALLYSPTWEGYGTGPVNYSSVSRGRGFSFLPEIAKACEAQNIIVKPHPYLGLLKPRLIKDFIDGVRFLINKGLSVTLALHDSNLPLRLLCRTHLHGLDLIEETGEGSVPVCMGLCDISGMEAVFLKQRVPSMTLCPTTELPLALRKIYGKKILWPQSIYQEAVEGYLADAQEIDEQHRRLVFGWQTSDLSEMSHAARRNWLIDYVQSDPFWKREPAFRKETAL